MKVAAALSCGARLDILISRRFSLGSKVLHVIGMEEEEEEEESRSSLRKSRVNVWLLMSVKRIHSLSNSFSHSRICAIRRSHSSRTLLYGCFLMVGHAARVPRKLFSSSGLVIGLSKSMLVISPVEYGWMDNGGYIYAVANDINQHHDILVLPT